MNAFKTKLKKEYQEFNEHVKGIKTNGKLQYYNMYNQQKQKIGKVNTKYEKKQGQWLKGISVFPITEVGEIIFEKRADTELTPNAIDICSGHIDNEENSVQATYRELREELGIKKENIKLLYKIGVDVPMIFAGNRKFFIQFYMCIVKKCSINKQNEEVKETFTIGLKDGFKLIKDGNTKFPYEGNEETFEYIFTSIENQYYHYKKQENDLEI